jgi:hypothetical protein
MIITDYNRLLRWECNEELLRKVGVRQLEQRLRAYRTPSLGRAGELWSTVWDTNGEPLAW